MVVAATARFTVNDLAMMPDGDRFELIHGHLVEREMSPNSVFIAGKIFRKLDEYCERNGFAVAFTDGAGYTLRPDELDLLRKPDASVVMLSRLPNGVIPTSRFEFSPDLAMEVMSPSDIAYDIETKIQEYLDAGTQIVWLAKPMSRRIMVYRPDQMEITFGPDDTITAEPVLPGFAMRVGDVFPPVIGPVHS